MLTRLLALFICGGQKDHHRVQHKIGLPSWPNCTTCIQLCGVNGGGGGVGGGDTFLFYIVPGVYDYK